MKENQMLKILQLLKSLLSKLTLIVGFMVISGCSKDIKVHGFNFEHYNTYTIAAGKTSKQQVLSELGTPTTESNFGQKKFYYISSKVQRIAFFEPKILEQKVLVIDFDSTDTVTNITQLTLDDANKIIFSENRTEVKGNSITAVQQILTNIGKHNINNKK